MNLRPRGAVAYMLKPEKRGSEPPHWLCPNCFANGKKTFLIATGTKERGYPIFKCAVCGTQPVASGDMQWQN